MNEVFGMIVLGIIGLFLLYVVIFTAVREGINKSVIGQQANSKKSISKNDVNL